MTVKWSQLRCQAIIPLKFSNVQKRFFLKRITNYKCTWHKKSMYCFHLHYYIFYLTHCFHSSTLAGNHYPHSEWLISRKLRREKEIFELRLRKQFYVRNSKFDVRKNTQEEKYVRKSTFTYVIFNFTYCYVRLENFQWFSHLSPNLLY